MSEGATDFIFRVQSLEIVKVGCSEYTTHIIQWVCSQTVPMGLVYCKERDLLILLQ